MSRNSSGTYSLPAGNPVVTGTTITSSWANTTLSDIASALTDSLSRTGLGSMQAGLPLFDGTSSLPGLAWGTELTSGFYRAGAADYRWVITTTELLQLTSNLLRLSGTAPIFRINESDASANNRLWDVIVSGEDMNFRVLTDALVATNWLTVTRTAGTVDAITLTSTTATITGETTFSNLGPAFVINRATGAPSFRMNEAAASANNRLWDVAVSSEQMQFRLVNDAVSAATSWLQVDRTDNTVDTVNFVNGTLQYGGLEVGYRNIPNRNIAVSDNTQAADRGTIITYSGAGGHTFTVDSDFIATYTLTFINAGSGAMSIAESLAGSLFWFNGSGALGTGTRTLAVGGVATLYMVDNSSCYIWGTGLS